MTNDIFKYLRSRNYISFKPVASVNDCMIDMTTRVDVVTDSADVYEGAALLRIGRRTPPGQNDSWIFAFGDIDNIDKAAIKCIDIIDKHVMPK